MRLQSSFKAGAYCVEVGVDRNGDVSSGRLRPLKERVMAEFFRSGAIMLMGLTVVAAGIAVVVLG